LLRIVDRSEEHVVHACAHERKMVQARLVILQWWRGGAYSECGKCGEYSSIY
jgi:hypothetical protein